eukprot:scaffold35193_cov31-Tisochrysis_lutea.AAC.1
MSAPHTPVPVSLGSTREDQAPLGVVARSAEWGARELHIVCHPRWASPRVPHECEFGAFCPSPVELRIGQPELLA